MKIRIASLKDGLNRWRETASPIELDLKPSIYRQDVTVDLTVEKRVGNISVGVAASTIINFICDRCGEEFQRELVGDCSVLFVKYDRHLPDEIPGDDIRSYLNGQEELDITAEVRDALLLSVPMKLLCSEDCRGLCQGCGANLNLEECRCAVNPTAANQSASWRTINKG